MKKLIWGFTIFFVLVAGTLLVGPSLIDWNSYKGDVAKKVKALTGRDLKILGDVQVSLFPAPAVIANDVSLSNMEGAATPNMITLQRAEVRIAMGPLLAGQIKVETVRLIKPVIELELLADGRQNWNIESPTASADKPVSTETSSPSSSSSGSSAPAIVLDDFTIIDGALNYRDSALGTIEQVAGLNARIEAASLAGPFQSKGDLTLRNIPLTYEITVGEVIQERTLPLNLKLGVGAGDSSLHIGGTILNLTEVPKFKGSLKGEGKNLGLLIEAITRTPTPPALAQLFSIEGNISASVSGGQIADLSMQLADSRVEGDIAVEMSETPRFSVSLTAGRFDLDKWLNVPNSTKKPAQQAAKAPEPVSLAVPEKGGSTAQAPVQVSTGVIIPINLSGSVIVSLEALVYRGEVVSDVLINTELADGAAHLRQFSAQFPGGSDITMSGVLTSPGGKPDFSGNIETTTNDLRKVVEWVGAEIPDVPADRLRKFGFVSDIRLSPEQIKLQNISVQFDSSRLNGAATIALRERLAFGINLTLDQINADAYLPTTSTTEKPQAAANTETEKPATAGAPTEQKTTQPVASGNPFNGLAALADFDANVLLNIKRLVLHGETLQNVAVDTTLYDGGLDIRKMNVGQVVGASLSASGKINDLRDIPSAEGLRIQFKTKDLAPLARLAGQKLPFDIGNLGATSVDLTADGSFLKPKIDASLKTAGADIKAKGVVSLLPVGDMFDVAIQLAHPDLVRLLRTFGVAYQPMGKIGAVNFTTQASGNPENITLGKLSGNIGSINFGGSGALALAGARPKITADLKTGALALDPFMPVTQKAGLEQELWQALKRRPVVWPGPDVTQHQSPIINVASLQHWPEDPIDFSVLNSFDADLSLKAPIITISKYLFEKIDAVAEIKNGTLNTKKLVGTLFGGQLQGNAQVSAADNNKIVSNFSISNIQIADALKSVTGTATASGELDANLDFTASGNSVAALISTLNGTGGFSMQDVDATGGVKGSVFAGVYKLLTSLNRLGSSRSGNKADVSGTFQITKGVAKSTDLRLASALGNGSADGTVDLPGWLLDMKGQIELQQSALTQILQAKLKKGASPVAFTISGPLDAPDVSIDTGALLGGGLPIPGADALFNKAPKGIGNVLKGLLGGGSAAPATPSAETPQGVDTPPPARSTEQQQAPAKKITPEDLLKQLFK